MSEQFRLFVQCICLPFVLPSFCMGFYLGRRYQTHGFPGMFIPARWQK